MLTKFCLLIKKIKKMAVKNEKKQYKIKKNIGYALVRTSVGQAVWNWNKATMLPLRVIYYTRFFLFLDIL